jgi:hypothetical protein
MAAPKQIIFWQLPHTTIGLPIANLYTNKDILNSVSKIQARHGIQTMFMLVHSESGQLRICPNDLVFQNLERSKSPGNVYYITDQECGLRMWVGQRPPPGYCAD